MNNTRLVLTPFFGLIAMEQAADAPALDKDKRNWYSKNKIKDIRIHERNVLLEFIRNGHAGTREDIVRATILSRV